MNVKSYEKKEKNVAELTVTVSAEEFDNAVNTAYKRSKNQIAVPGFRKGKAPRKIIENMYGASIFYNDAIEIIHPDAFRYGVEDQKLVPVGMPSIIDIDFADDKSVSITYSITLYPEVTLGEYKGLSAIKPSAEVTDKDLDNEIEMVRKRNARMETVDRASKNGDMVVIDFEGFIDGKAFDGGKGENYDLFLGSHKFIPGFEEQIEGMAAGEERDINLVFPDDYTEEFAGKPVVFKVKVHEVKESVLPELDDEFAKDVSEFDTLEEYRNSLREEVGAKKENEAEKMFEDALMDQVISNMDCDVPDVMIDEQTSTAINNFSNSLATYGMNLEMYYNTMGINEEQFRESMRPSSEKHLKISLALEKIAEVENIEATDEEKEEEYKKMAEKYGVEVDKAKQGIDEKMIVHEIKLRKAAELVCNSATELPEPPKEAAKEEKEEEKPVKKTAAKKNAVKSTDDAEKPATKKTTTKKTTTKKTATTEKEKPVQKKTTKKAETEETDKKAD